MAAVLTAKIRACANVTSLSESQKPPIRGILRQCPISPWSAAGACASRPRRESPAEDFLTCTYFLIEGNFCGWLC
ncbi:hypothetical protein DPMN_097606 [Dreissena polymorpha]|uniref:Uncharacterized protein n=1 Tax=Dreissena polymorpha TaxID=45954 RepID=A0A9D4R4Q2_DREPO|nr:hypothetical protein DPMN_097606 [Dreissena polymorpha]